MSIARIYFVCLIIVSVCDFILEYSYSTTSRMYVLWVLRVVFLFTLTLIQQILLKFVQYIYIYIYI